VVLWNKTKRGRQPWLAIVKQAGTQISFRIMTAATRHAGTGM
jgi:hypothetical protein